MEILFKAAYIESGLLSAVLNEVSWTNRNAPRDEAFQSAITRSYTYGKGAGERTYTSSEFTPTVKRILEKLNSEFNTDYNVVFLNLYLNQYQHLGWHADDSPSMDSNHPIAVISLGEARYIYVRENGFSGEVAEKDKHLLTDGSLFVMPAGMQETHQHKIPKGDRPMSMRISLTFRRYLD